MCKIFIYMVGLALNNIKRTVKKVSANFWRSEEIFFKIMFQISRLRILALDSTIEDFMWPNVAKRKIVQRCFSRSLVNSYLVTKIWKLDKASWTYSNWLCIYLWVWSRWRSAPRSPRTGPWSAGLQLWKHRASAGLLYRWLQAERSHGYTLN